MLVSGEIVGIFVGTGWRPMSVKKPLCVFALKTFANCLKCRSDLFFSERSTRSHMFRRIPSRSEPITSSRFSSRFQRRYPAVRMTSFSKWRLIATVRRLDRSGVQKCKSCVTANCAHQDYSAATVPMCRGCTQFLGG